MIRKKLFLGMMVWIVTLTCGVAQGAGAQVEDKPSRNHPTNVILMVGDGMGFSQVTAAAYVKGEGVTPGSLHMLNLNPYGNVTTHSHNSVVTDSAAAATALASGHKTDNGHLGEGPDFRRVRTVLEVAEQKGMKTGLVTTARLTHATPGAFVAHVRDRHEENQVADQLLQRRVDVMMGGGLRHFLPADQGGQRQDGKNLLDEARNRGYTVVKNDHQLQQAGDGKLLGLFNLSHMTYDLDRELTDEPSLAEMTQQAIRRLQRGGKGFFLMVEGGRIDHAGHANDPAANIRETLAFDQAVREAARFAGKDGNTLLMVTADHETGGMSVGANGEKAFHKEVIRKVKRSAHFIAGKLKPDGSNLEEMLGRYAGIRDLKREEKQKILSAGEKEEGIARVISDRALIGWTTHTHTAMNVPLFCGGLCSERPQGTIDNTDIARIIFDAIGKKR